MSCLNSFATDNIIMCGWGLVHQETCFARFSRYSEAFASEYLGNLEKHATIIN